MLRVRSNRVVAVALGRLLAPTSRAVLTLPYRSFHTTGLSLLKVPPRSAEKVTTATETEEKGKGEKGEKGEKKSFWPFQRGSNKSTEEKTTTTAEPTAEVTIRAPRGKAETIKLHLPADWQNGVPIHLPNQGGGIVNYVLVGSLFVCVAVVIWHTFGRNFFGPNRFAINASQLEIGADEVQGCDEAKEEIMEIADFFKNPAKYERLKAKVPRGMLLVGPPGTGKTMMAKALAKESGCSFFSICGSEVDGMYVGSGSSTIRKLFKSARRKIENDQGTNGAIIFIDEIDAFAGKRGGHYTQSGVYRASLNQLLTEMDGFKARDRVVVVAATNKVDLLDKALLRPGRFDKQVRVDHPDCKGREKILNVYLKRVPNSLGEAEVKALAKGTIGMTGSALKNLVNQAAVRAAQVASKEITQEHLEFARDRVIMGAGKTSRVIPESARKLTAYHEAGHALVALKTEGAATLWKASILPRGAAGGVTHFHPTKENELDSRKELFADMCVSMGGRAAEELIYGPDGITPGASSDFQHATQLANSMVSQWGLTSMGTRVLRESSIEDQGLSDQTKAARDEQVNKLLEKAYAHAMKVLHDHRVKLDALASELLEHETVAGERLKELAA